MNDPVASPYVNSLPLLPMRGGAILPGMRVRVPISRRRSLALVRTLAPGASIVVAFQRDAKVVDPALHDLLPIGVRAEVVSVERRTGGGRLLTLDGRERCELEHLAGRDPFWTAVAGPVVYPDGASPEEARLLATALLDGLRERTGEEQTAPAPDPVDAAGAVADFVAARLRLSPEERFQVVLAVEECERLRLVMRLAGERIESSEIEARIEAEVRDALGRQQREAVLRQRLRAIQKELGQRDEDEEDEVGTLRARLDVLLLSEEVRKVVDRELRRFEASQPGQAEHNVSRNYLEWIASLPWGQSVESDADLDAVAAQLDADHYGLDDVKKRIVEHMAVLKLTGGKTGTILCLAGPPGVGKTSLGQSIARATGRPFVRVALGGVRDEAEIRGHRRTYVGALPGRILHGLRQAEADNPVFLLDEVDKLSFGGWSGNPEAALLEVLDPEQNSTFTDHYLELPFDLSKVLFICTANDLSRITPPLRDRMEVVEIAGYSPDEKVHIAREHLIEEQLSRHGIQQSALTLDDEALSAMIRDYTREAGVRQLKREIARVCRALAVEVARSEDATLNVSPDKVGELLGKPRFRTDLAERLTQPGIATGLAWTPAGGDILFIETSRMPGSGKLEVTGQLGDVMKESARAALTYVRSHAEALNVAPDFLQGQDVHIHVPAGAVPKDGPSAGVTMFTALTSLLCDQQVRSDTAMTGECTLRGRVLPVGGIKSKVLAAHRAGLRRVILPRQNERDLDDVPAAIRAEMEVILVDDMQEVLAEALAA